MGDSLDVPHPMHFSSRHILLTGSGLLGCPRAMEPGLVTLPLRAGTVTCPSAFGSAEVQPAHEPVRHLYVTLSSLHLPLPSPLPHLPWFGALCLAAWWPSLPEVWCLRVLAVTFCSALPTIDCSGITSSALR